jgi:predicted nucleic acid-binding Zn ribbon protein
MRSFLDDKIMNTFFEKSPRRNKPLMFVQIILAFIAIFVWFQARNKIDTPVYYTYSGILDIIVGFVMLLIGIENYIVNKRNKKEYIIWFVIALMFFGMAIDQFFFLR